jgi:hypothetical protein
LVLVIIAQSKLASIKHAVWLQAEQRQEVWLHASRQILNPHLDILLFLEVASNPLHLP